MTQNTLYLKYRPNDFSEVLGQDEIVTALQNSIKNKNFSHSYLFSGTRGTGKTSIARIFSNQLGVASEDLYEMDAASNRCISEIREIRDGVDILPLKSEYKVYIIDEVHMLTKEAFNALLKTLEEPPAHVIFILATTEKHKILDTILSRCTVFDFKKPNLNTLSELINKVCKKEKRKIDEESVLHIAQKSDGSFRDTLSYLQRIFSIFTKDINFSELEKKVGLSTTQLEDNFLKSLSDKDKEKTFGLWKDFLEEGISIDILSNNLLEKVRLSLLVKNSSAFEKKYKYEFSEDGFSFLKLLSFNSVDLKKFLDLAEKISISSFKEIEFEIFLDKYFQ